VVAGAGVAVDKATCSATFTLSSILDEGQLLEEGGHENLLELGGKYAQMFAAQAARYR
jgi:ABC-type transport system involved in cytochrome bd biosynthesis fused ATPase/permease subunit